MKWYHNFRLKLKRGDYDETLGMVFSCFMTALIVIFFVTLCFFLSGCRSVHDVEYISRTDTITRNVVSHDSIFLHDSVYHEVIQRGDTIYNTKFVLNTRYKDRVLHDSIYISKTDTVYHEIEKIVKPKQSLWQRVSDVIGCFVAVCFMLMLAMLIIRIVIVRLSDRK